MKGYINFRDVPGAIGVEEISAWHEAEYNSMPFHHLKGSSDRVRFSSKIIVFDDGTRREARCAEIIPPNGYYEFPFLVRKKDLKL